MKEFRIALIGSLLCLFLTLPGIAAADPVIAEVENLGDTLVFHPVTEFAKLVLTVSGPCDFHYRQEVTQGAPFFRLDQTTIDGRYRYDLVRIESIDPDIVKVLLEARQNFDEETPRALCRAGKLPAAPISQSAGFGVLRGEIVYDPGSIEKAGGTVDLDELYADTLRDATESGLISKEPALNRPGGIPTKDFVIIDDLIVDGSACIGFDCVNGESFGFDTIRVKENNLRIKFDDTSTAASFPRNDWQLTANDSANGGASKFSIDDISGSRTPFTVEANARSHSLYVDDGGRIGSRTSTPSVEIHTIDGDTPTLRLQQDGSSGFAPQTWDVAGNETNFFVRDVTNGSTLPFRIRPGAPSSAIFIDVDGDVGLGTSSPHAPLHVLGSGTSFDTGFGSQILTLQNNASASDGMIVSLIPGSTGTAQITFGDTGGGGVTDGRILYDNNANEMVFRTNGSNHMTLGPAGALSITGPCSGCDAVFQSDWPLQSIEEHAETMWDNNYLPGVGPTPDGQTSIDVFQKVTGILQEVETAHIYIEQLHNKIKQLEQRLEELEAKDAD